MEKISEPIVSEKKSINFTYSKNRNVLHTVNIRKAMWTGRILRSKCLLKHVIQGRMEGRMEVRKEEEEGVSCYWMT